MSAWKDQKVSFNKINKLRNIRIALDEITTDCFENKYPSHISNHFCTVLSLLDDNIKELWIYKNKLESEERK